MSEITLFECDVTGDRFGAKNDVWEYTIRRRWSHTPFNVREYTVHFSDDALDVADVDVAVSLIPSQLDVDYIAVEGRDVVGMSKDGEYRDRDDVVWDHYETFYQFIETDVIV